MITGLATNWGGACGHTCYGHFIQPDFSKRLVSWPHSSLLQNFKVMYNSSNHCERAIEMGLLCKGQASNRNLRSALRGMKRNTTFQVDSKFYPRRSRVGPLINGQRNLAGSWKYRLYAMAMDKMQITENDIREAAELVEQGGKSLGKELPDTWGKVDENKDEPNLGDVPAEMKECYDLWQRIGVPVEKIARQRNMTETGVFYCLFTCIQNNYTVDWYELCKEAQFTSTIAKTLIQATEEFVAEAASDPVDPETFRQHLPKETTDIHFGLYISMLNRGFPYQTIKDISVQTGTENPDLAWGEIYASINRFPREVTESGLLQWLSEKGGASLVDIALKYRDCEDLKLLRLIVKLEESGKLFWRQGVFRAV